MSGDTDEPVSSQQTPSHVDRQTVRTQMDPGKIQCENQIDPVVHQQGNSVRLGDGPNVLCQCEQFANGQIPLSQLNRRRSSLGRLPKQSMKRSSGCLMPVGNEQQPEANGGHKAVTSAG
jgi:hypothetical protein